MHTSLHTYVTKTLTAFLWKYLIHTNIYFWLKRHTVYNIKHLENHCVCVWCQKNGSLTVYSQSWYCAPFQGYARSHLLLSIDVYPYRVLNTLFPLFRCWPHKLLYSCVIIRDGYWIINTSKLSTVFPSTFWEQEARNSKFLFGLVQFTYLFCYTH